MGNSTAQITYCAQCGAVAKAPPANNCWLCGCNLNGNLAQFAAPPEPSAPLHRPRDWEWLIGMSLATVTVLAVLVGALLVAPGFAFVLAIVLLALVLPAVRTWLITTPRGARAPEYNRAGRAGVFIESAAINIAATIAGTFCAASVFFVALVIALSEGCGASIKPGEPQYYVAWASPIVGIAVVILLIGLSLPGRPRVP